MKLIDPSLVITQIIGFLLMVWILRRYAWGPVLGMLEARRQKIAGEFAAADRAKAEANELKTRYEQELRGIEAQARQRLQEAVVEGQHVAAEIKTQAQREAEGQRVAGEIRAQAQKEAGDRLARAQDEIAREREKAKESLKLQVIKLSMRTAEKILHRKLDDSTHRELVGEFIDEVGALP